MSHIDNESQSTYRRVVEYHPARLKELRKSKNRWALAVYIPLAAWLCLMIVAISQDIIMTLAAMVMLIPLYVTTTKGAEALRAYRPEAEAATFVHTWRHFFEKWMQSEDAKQSGFRTVTMKVSMSSEQPGVLTVTVSHFEPMFEPMVFELGAHFVGSYDNVDMKKLFPILRDAVSNSNTAGVSAKELVGHFDRVTVPMVSEELRGAIALRADD